MKKLIISALAVFMSSAAFAGNDIAHYDTDTIKDSAHAVSILKEAKNVIFNTLSLPEISSSAYEELHQLSYSMEAAIEKIEDDALYSESVIDPLEDAIEEIHKASEDYKKDDLKKASKEYSHLLQALLKNR